MAWGIGAITNKLKAMVAPTTTKPLSKMTLNSPKPALGTLATAFAVKAKKLQTTPMPTDAAIVSKEKRTVVIHRPSVVSTFSSPLSNPHIGMTRIHKTQESPKVKHDKLYKPVPHKQKVQPYRPAWGGFKWA
jgi:hypothetical protein